MYIQKDFVESDKVYIRNLLDCLNVAGIFIKRDQKSPLTGNAETTPTGNAVHIKSHKKRSQSTYTDIKQNVI